MKKLLTLAFAMLLFCICVASISFQHKHEVPHSSRESVRHAIDSMEFKTMMEYYTK